MHFLLKHVLQLTYVMKQKHKKLTEFWQPVAINEIFCFNIKKFMLTFKKASEICHKTFVVECVYLSQLSFYFDLNLLYFIFCRFKMRVNYKNKYKYE